MWIFQKHKINKNRNDLRSGYHLETPDIFVPWDITPKELIDLFEDLPLNKVTKDYFTIECISLGGLKHKLGFHFESKSPRRLNTLEVFRDSYPNYKESFKEFQDHIEFVYGRASKKYPKNSEGFPSYEWLIGDSIRIQHFIMERFGLEEKLHIQRAW